jgi:DUF1680 family protein
VFWRASPRWPEASLGRSALECWAQQSGKPDDFVSAKPDKLVPFPMTQVRLLTESSRQQAEINQKYLDSLTTDRLLHSFRLTAGIPSTATPYGGWEKPDCTLRGHFNGGHYLSAVALAYASAGNDTLRKSGDTMVAELARCQKANGNGYLSAFPEAQFELLAAGVTEYPKVWAPFYTCTRSWPAWWTCTSTPATSRRWRARKEWLDWVRAYFQGIADDQRQFMLRIEYGGMNEVLANLYGLTGKQQYLDTARLFEQPAFLDPLAGHRDELKGLHANTHVPKVIGAARMYELTGRARYRDIAQYFLEEVLTERSYAIGNTSVGESWRSDPGDLKGSLQYHDAECCVAYNLMKLERHAFAWTGDARWMDAYERSLWNCRMGTQNPQGLKQYFFPLAAGYWRYYNSAEARSGAAPAPARRSSPSSTTRFISTMATASGSTSSSPPNSTGRSRSSACARRLFPAEQGTTLRIKVAAPQRRTIHIRIPAWVAEGGSVKHQRPRTWKPLRSRAAISRSPASGTMATRSSLAADAASHGGPCRAMRKQSAGGPVRPAGAGCGPRARAGTDGR